MVKAFFFGRHISGRNDSSDAVSPGLYYNQEAAPRIGLPIDQEATLTCSANVGIIRTGLLGFIWSNLVEQDVVDIALIPIEIDKPHIKL